jgi:diguanylate cyclase (GGDEF)-like protein
MELRWRQAYSWIKSAVFNLDSIESLLSQAVEKIAALYKADCLLWSGLEGEITNSLYVYGTDNAVDQCTTDVSFSSTSRENPEGLTRAQAVRQFCPRSLPDWLVDQQKHPRLLQLETGDLIVPVMLRIVPVEPRLCSEKVSQEIASNTDSLQLVLQLSRPLDDRSLLAGMTCITANTATIAAASVIQGWTMEELESLEIIGSQIGLAYSALRWRQRLEQSWQQAALVGRISQLLNSTLNPDEVVNRIVAELGNELQCDRSVLINLRQETTSILATWEHPKRALLPLTKELIDQGDFQIITTRFLQSGASYLQIDHVDPLALNQLAPTPLQRWLGTIGAESVLLVPLFIQAEFFGFVALLSYQQKRHYRPDELQMVRQVADQAAIALTNAQHYQRLWLRQKVLQQQNSTLQREATRDSLTQLLNRRSLERELEQLSTTAIWTALSTFSIIVCDIDHFKRVNDAYGHLVGDEVLCALAQRLQSQLRRGTPAYRYGGEEFIIILAETPLEQAVDVSERLRQTVRTAPIVTQSGPIVATASFGIAQQDLLHDQSAWDVLRRADRALYNAKRLGRDRVCTVEFE